MNRKFDFWSVLAMCLCTAVLSMGLVYGLFFYYIGGMDGFRMVEKLIAVKAVVDQNYVGETDWDKASDLMAEAIVEATGDRWSYYLTAEDYEALRHRSNNTSSGIGVSVQLDEEGRGVKIVKVTEDTPAANAGLKEGFVIVEVAGESLSGLSIDEITVIIKSQTGEYSLVYVNEAGKEISCLISNAPIFSSPVKHTMLEGNIGYIRIANFEAGAAEGVSGAKAELLEQGAEAFIFDVRYNPGGQLVELTAMLDELLPEGEMFISVNSEGVEEIEYSDPECLAPQIPIVVLMDENTYSAAEFFAAALSEYERAVLIGSPTTGKARSQQNFILHDGSVVHISTENYLTPNRVNLAEAGGLVPDIEAAPEGEEDIALQRALEYLA